MPVQVPVSLENLVEFVDEAEAPPTSNSPQWEKFWKASSEILGPKIAPQETGESLPMVGAADMETCLVAAKAMQRYIEARTEETGPLAPSAAMVLDWLATHSLSAEHTVRDMIGRVLELVVASECEEHEMFYGGLLMHCILRCLDTKATMADVSRLYRHRELLRALDWEDESIEDLKDRLLQCAMSGLVLKSPDAPGLIGFLYTLSPNFVHELHHIVKMQIPVCRPSMVSVYAQGLYKGWKMSSGGVTLQLEASMQDWMMLSVTRQPNMASKARGMLAEFHTHRGTAVEELLCRLYGPILWRNLKVANWKVRFNACALLSVAFPLVEPTLGVADHEEAMNRQYAYMRDLINDPHDEVRKAAINGTCRILNRFWEIVPPGVSAVFLADMMEKCANDRSSPGVRAAVPEGLSMILKNPLSHAALKSMLPSIGPMLNDKSPLVRFNVGKLLTTVSCSKNISVFSIVAQPDLLARLAREHELSLTEPRPHVPVAQTLTQLLQMSLFGQQIKEQVKRCVFLIKRYPASFIALLHHNKVEPLDRIRLAAALFSTAMSRSTTAAHAAKATGKVTPEEIVASPEWTDDLSVTLMMLRGVRTLLKTTKNFLDGDEGLVKFAHQHISEESLVSFLHPAYQMRAHIAVVLEHLKKHKFPRVCDFVTTQMATMWKEQTFFERVKDPEVWAVVHLGLRWDMLEPLEVHILSKIEELEALLGEHENEVKTGAKVKTTVDLSRQKELRMSVELLAELFSRPDSPISNDFNSKIVILSDAIASLALASAKRLSLGFNNGPLKTPLNHSILGFPDYVRDVLPSLMAVLGRAMLQCKDAAQPLGTLADAFCSADFLNNVEILDRCGRGDLKPKNEKERKAWTNWQAEAATAARVHEHMCQQVMVATLAGQLGLTEKLQVLCSQMMKWAKVADFMACLSGQGEGDALRSAWKTCADTIKQLVFAKVPACQTLDLAALVFSQANAETAPVLAKFVLGKFEHHEELPAMLEKRDEWPQTVVAAVEEVADLFPSLKAIFETPNSDSDVDMDKKSASVFSPDGRSNVLNSIDPL